MVGLVWYGRFGLVWYRRPARAGALKFKTCNKLFWNYSGCRTRTRTRTRTDDGNSDNKAISVQLSWGLTELGNYVFINGFYSCEIWLVKKITLEAWEHSSSRIGQIFMMEIWRVGDQWLLISLQWLTAVFSCLSHCKKETSGSGWQLVMFSNNKSILCR